MSNSPGLYPGFFMSIISIFESLHCSLSFMKKCLFLFCLLCTLSQAKAQNTFSNTGSGLNDVSRYMEDDDSTADDGTAIDDEEGAVKNLNADPLADISMTISDSMVTFDGVPEKGNITAHITTADGEEIETRMVNARKLSFPIHRLPKQLFFVTLTYRKYRKAFELNRGEEQVTETLKKKRK